MLAQELKDLGDQKCTRQPGAQQAGKKHPATRYTHGKPQSAQSDRKAAPYVGRYHTKSYVPAAHSPPPYVIIIDIFVPPQEIKAHAQHSQEVYNEYGKIYRVDQISTNMMNLRLIVLAAVLGLFSRCAPQQVQTGRITTTYLPDTIPYRLAQQPRQEKGLALFVGPLLDSLPVFDQAWTAPLWKAGYSFLVIDRPYPEDFYKQAQRSDMSRRHGDVQQAVFGLAAKGIIDTSQNFLLISSEEGGYLAPELSRSLQTDTTVVINADPFGPIGQMERWTQDTILTSADSTLMALFEKTDTAAFREAINQVSQPGRLDKMDLGPRTNRYWITFNQSNQAESYQRAPGYFLWLFFQDYPLHFEADADYVRILSQVRGGDGAILELPGTGFFQDARTRAGLKKAMEQIAP